MIPVKSIRKNIFANTVGRLWAAISNVIFVPLFIALLGGDGYGLIVAYTTLFASLQVLDAGLSSALSRELALRLARAHDITALRSVINLTKTVERISVSSGLIVGLIVILLAPAIAAKWLLVRPEMRATTLDSIRLIGVIIAVQWPSMAYQGAMMGLQDQVRANLARMGSAAIQALGALLVMRNISASTEAFFGWVLVCQFGNTLLLRHMVWAHLRRITGELPRFRWEEVSRIWKFAGGIATIALLSAILTQADKIILSKFVPIAEFGIYGVAYTLSAVLGLLAQPILAGLLPRFAQLFATEDYIELGRLYSRGCELIALFTIPCWVILVFHSRELMNLWMGDTPESAAVAGLLPILGSGMLANALVTLPYGLQVAAGWTSLSVIKNVITVALAVPAMLVVIPRYGASGAATIWLLVNCGYLLVEIPIMYRKIPISGMGRWYLRTVLLPIVVGVLVGALSMKLQLPAGQRFLLFCSLGLLFLVTATCLVAILPAIRHGLKNQIMAQVSMS